MTPNFLRARTCLAMAGFAAATLSGVADAAITADYRFDNTLASSVGGAPSLVVTDPLNQSGFATDTVFGASRTVFRFAGNSAPVTEQAGLTLDTTGLTNGSTYSVEMVVSFDGETGWRRLIDVQGRASDNGLYIDPSDKLNLYPDVGGSTDFTAGTYHHVTFVNEALPGGTTVRGYLDGVFQFTEATGLMGLANADNPALLMHFFLDNVVAGGQGEFSSGRVALIRFHDAALTDAEVTAFSATPFAPVPEPETYALLLAGLGLVGVAARRARRTA